MLIIMPLWLWLLLAPLQLTWRIAIWTLALTLRVSVWTIRHARTRRARSTEPRATRDR